ncbi:MAG: hypothetical protein C0501_12945 [Isosphaera sp.]|nr:hypothetical protein [Isosphaera sp.]
MFSRPLAAALAVLIALPACNKDKPAPNPDTAPPPTPAPNPNKGKDPKDPKDQDPPPPVEPGLPTFPFPNRPIYATAAGAPFRLASENNLKEIAIGFLAFQDAFMYTPVGIADKDKKLGLSWRVALLPYLGQDALYKEFKLDEPWNSEHNKKLIPKMPKVYSPPRVDANGYTFYRSFTGPDTVMPPGGQAFPGAPVRGRVLFAIPDGSSNTLLVAEAYDPVIWTKPDELAFAPGKPPKMGGVFAAGFNAAFCDGSVKFLPIGLPPNTLCDLIQTNDGRAIQLP